MNVGSLPQSMDGVGIFRYTTKISEYAAAGLPIVMNQTPCAYDLDDGSFWRIPGATPWSEESIAALTQLMATITRQEIDAKRRYIDANRSLFCLAEQRRRITAFISDILM